MSIVVTLNEKIPLNLVLEDGNPTKFVRASLYDNERNFLGEVQLTHEANGLYRDDSVVASLPLKRVFAVYEVFNDALFNDVCADYDLRSEDVFDIDLSMSANEVRSIVSVPDKMELPYSGSKTYRCVVYLFDTQNLPTDPDGNLVNVHIEDINNGEVVTTTPCTREQKGVYFYRYTVSSALDEQPIWVEFSFEKGGNHFLVGAVSELIKTDARTISLDQVKLTQTRANLLDNMDVAVSTRQSAVTALGQFDTTQASIADLKSTVITVDNDVLALTSTIDAIKIETDKIGNPVHGTLASDNSNLEALILQTQGKVDTSYTNLDKHLLSQDLILSNIESDTSLIGAPIHGTLAIDNQNLSNQITAVQSQNTVTQTAISNVLTRIGIPTLGTVSADIAAIFADTDYLSNALFLDRVEALDFLDLPLSTLETNLVALDRYNSLFAEIQAVLGAVGAIPNNTTFVGIVPPILVLPLPTELTKTYKFYVNLFDQQGIPQDPDGNITYRVETVNGIIVVGNTNMIRESQGQYWCSYVVNTGDVERALFVVFQYQKNSVDYKQVRITEVQEYESKLDTIVSRLTAARASNLDKIDTTISSRLSGDDAQNYQAVLLGKFAEVLTSEQALATLLGVPTVSIAQDMNIIKAYVEKIGTPSFGTLSDMLNMVQVETARIGVPSSGTIANDIRQTQIKIDAIPDYTATLAAIQSKLDLVREKIGYALPETIEELISGLDVDAALAALTALQLDIDSLRSQVSQVSTQILGVKADTSLLNGIQSTIETVDLNVLGLISDVAKVNTYVDNLPIIELAIGSLLTKSDEIYGLTDTISVKLSLVPTNPLLETDWRLGYIDAPISSRAEPSDCDGGSFVGGASSSSMDLVGVVEEQELVLGMVDDGTLVGVLEESQ